MIFNRTTDYLRAFEQDPSLAILPMQMVADSRGVTRAAIDRMLRINQLQEVRVGKTRYVRAASVIALQHDKDKQIATVRQHLEKIANKQKSVTYEPVMSLVGLSWRVPADRSTIGAILGAVSEQTWEEHHLLLSVIVHRKMSGRSRPGPGFFDLARSIKGFPSWSDEDALVERETKRVFKFYSTGVDRSAR